MLMHTVNSSRMRRVGWENNTLFIEFHNGAIYAYSNVTEAEYKNFINSTSLGSALNVLDKKHPYHRVK